MPALMQQRLCQYCSLPVAVNKQGKRNKGYYKTCGAKKCLKMAQETKQASTWKPRICEFCKAGYHPTGSKQRWCAVCVPDFSWRSRATRYGIGKPQWQALLELQGGTCALCDAEPKVVDHDHGSGKTRGLLCLSCNLLISGLDADPDWISRAKEYLCAISE